MPFSRERSEREKGEGMVFVFLGGEAAQKYKNHLLRGFFSV